MTLSPVAKLTGARLSFHFFVLPSSPTRHVSGCPLPLFLPLSRWFRLPSCCFFLPRPVPLPPLRRRRPSVRFSDIRRMVLSTSFVPLTDIARPQDGVVGSRQVNLVREGAAGKYPLALQLQRRRHRLRDPLSLSSSLAAHQLASP